jgi:hypothetical protein
MWRAHVPIFAPFWPLQQITPLFLGNISLLDPSPALSCKNPLRFKFYAFPGRIRFCDVRWSGVAVRVGPADHFLTPLSGRDNANSRDFEGQFPGPGKAADGDKASLSHS